MTPADLARVIALAIEFVGGITLNMHILLVYIGNLKNGLSLGLSDKVHLTKALINLSQHLTMAAQNIIYVCWPHLFFLKENFVCSGMLLVFSNYYTYWLTALLCVYYCTNITSSGHHSIVWLKRNLSSYHLCIHLVLGLGCFVISIPIFLINDINSSGNRTFQSVIIRPTNLQDLPQRTTSTILGCFLPFTIAFISTTFSAWSLISHMQRMKENNWGVSKFQAQINATRTMILFLLISVIYGVTQLLFYTVPTGSSDTVFIIIWFVIISYPISEAIIIIQSSSKLRKTLLGKIFDRKRRNSETET